jgi:steroid delta-isomerase-like uncharacterized protein
MLACAGRRPRAHAPVLAARDCPLRLLARMDSRTVAARWMDEVWRQRRVEALETLHAAHFVDHSPAPGQSGDLAAYISGVRAFFAAFPDFEATTEALIVEGDHVAVRWRAGGTQREAFLGFPASGRRIHFRGIEDPPHS